MCGIGIKLVLIVIIIQVASINGEYFQDEEDLVGRFFGYFRTPNPKGVPILKIADPYPLPFDLIGPRIIVTNTSIFGIPNMIIEDAFIDVGQLEAQATLFFPVLTLEGTYEFTALLSSNTGYLNATLKDVVVITNASMVVEDGVIQMKDVSQNITKDELFLDLTDLTWLQQIIYDSGALHMFFYPVAELAFNQNKPTILNVTNTFLRRFSNRLPPIVTLPRSNKYYEQILDVPTDRRNLVIFVGRVLHYANLDPIYPPKKTISVLGINVELTDIEVTGISAVSDIKTLKIFYEEKKLTIQVSMVFPHILVRYNASFSRFFLKIKSRPRKINLHNLETNVTMVIDPGQVNSIQGIKFIAKADWIGNIARYNSESSFRKFLSGMEKFMQTHFLSIFIKILQPEIESRLKEKNLEQSILSFIKTV